MNLEELKVSDLMVRDVRQIGTDATLREAIAEMVRHGVHCLMIPSPAASQAPGIITSKDIVQLLGHAPISTLDELRVGDAMTTPAITLPEGLCVRDCINLLRMTGVRRAFVVRETTVVGVFSYTDVLFAIAGRPPH